MGADPGADWAAASSGGSVARVEQRPDRTFSGSGWAVRVDVDARTDPGTGMVGGEVKSMKEDIAEKSQKSVSPAVPRCGSAGDDKN